MNPSTDHVMAALSRSPLVAAIENAAQSLAGARILFMVRQGDDVVKLCPDGSATDLPAFCHVLRASRDGMRKCASCRALVGFGACYRGLMEYCCHGGLYVIAAPALDASGKASQAIVVCSSAFAAADWENGWVAVRAEADNAGVDLHALRNAYAQLPRLTPTNLSLAKALVEVTAAAVGEIARGLGTAVAGAVQEKTARDAGGERDLRERLTAALFVTRDVPAGKPRRQHGEILAELVQEMVARDPAIPLTVGRIAAAAHLTPNHFSALFRRHAGTSFHEFLLDRRMTQAQMLLRDLSLNVADIARRVGFPDAGHFARRFKERTGMTPTQWRDAL